MTKTLYAIDTLETARRINRHPMTVYKLIKEDPKFPRPKKIGRKLWFDPSAVDAYAEVIARPVAVEELEVA